MEDADRARTVRRLALGVAAVAIVAFLPAVRGAFVYDDHRFLADNGSLGFPEILWRAFADPSVQTADGTHAGLWRPLRTLLFAAERVGFGAAAWGPHAVSLLLHGLNAFLLTHLFAGLLRRPAAAAIGALIATCHPAQTEVVAWISSQGDLLALAFVLASLLAGLRGRDRAALVLGALALLSKEQAVVWPALVVVVSLAAGVDRRHTVRRALTAAGVTLAFVVLRHLVLDDPFQEGGLPAGRAGGAEILRMLGHQTALTILPVRPVFDWQLPPPVPGLRGLSLDGLLLGVFAAAPFVGLLRRDMRAPCAWFLIALVPTLFLQAVLPLNIRVADRFLAFALPGLGLVVGRALDARRAVLAPAALVVGMLMALSIDAGARFRSDRALWSHTVAHVSGHWRAEAWLGVTALREGRADEASERLGRAAAAAPGDAKTRFLHGRALEASARAAGEAARSGEMQTLFGRALVEYDAAATAYAAGGRQENRAAFEPLARLYALDLTLALGDRLGAADRLGTWLRDPPPDLPESARGPWKARLASLAGEVAIHLNEDLAARLRQWGARP